MTDKSAIAQAMKQICDEKGISYPAVLATVEAALAAAYRKDYGNKLQNIKVTFDADNGNFRVYDVKLVVADLTPEELAELEAAAEERAKAPEDRAPRPTPEPVALAEGEEEKKRFNPKTEMQLSDARKLKSGVQLGEEVSQELEVPGGFGRMAAQTAKQVITQKLREAEREMVFNEFKDRQGEILVGTVQRREGRLVLIDLGRVTGLLPPDEQIDRESYLPGEHLKVYVVSVTATPKGPEIIVSRSHPEIVRKLFTTEIPEVAAGTVQVKGIAREAGSRTKVAVWTDVPNIDPIGSCIGQRGSRVQTIISELKGEKVDIIEYSDDPAAYITKALSPAKITEVTIHEPQRSATVTVPEDQLSLAIGKAGQNVRLAARLTGWKIDIVGDGVTAPVASEAAGLSGVPATAESAPAEASAPAAEPKPAEAAPASEEPAAQKPKAKSKKKKG